MSKDIKSNEVNMRQEVLDMSEKLADQISIDKETGVSSMSVDIYKENCPEELNYEDILKVKKYDRLFFAASAHRFGEVAIEAMKANKDLKSATIDIPMTKYDTVTHNIERHKTYANHLTGKPTEKYGALITTYTNKGGKSNSADLKKVRKHLSDLAAEVLK